MKNKLIAALATLMLVGIGVAGVTTNAIAASVGYVLNNASSAIMVRGSDGILHQVAPGSSSARYMSDANSILVESGKVLRAGTGVYFGPTKITVRDGSVWTVASYTNR